MDINNNNIEQQNNDLAILVVSYDGYSDLWDDFFNLLKANWPDRHFPTYLANNIKKPNYPGVRVINCGEDAQWSKRTTIALEQIKEPYVCLLLEDYFIGDKVNNRFILDAIELMKQDQISYYKLNSFSKIRTKKYKHYNNIQLIPSGLEYGVSLQAAIWDKKFLIKLLGKENYSAWKFEHDRNREKLDSELFVFDNRNILNICHGVAKGKYLPSAISYFNDKNYSLDTSKRDMMSNKQFLIFKCKGILINLTPNWLKSLRSKLWK